MSSAIESAASKAAGTISGDPPPQFGSWVAILIEVVLPLVQGCLEKRSESDVAGEFKKPGLLAQWVIKRRIRSVVREFDLPRSEVKATEAKLYDAIISTCEGCDANAIVNEVNERVPDVDYIDMF